MAQVPNADVEFDGDGVTAIFDFDFPYQKESEIFVSVDGTNTPYTWVAGSTHSVQVLPAPALGTKVRIYRSTLAYVPLHVFAAGVPFLPRYVDENNRQLLYVVQEGIATSDDALAIAEEVRDRISITEEIAADSAEKAEAARVAAELATEVSGEASVAAGEALEVATGIAAVATQALETANLADAKAEEALEAVSEAGVASWNGRTAIVLPQAGDYDATQITYGAGDVATGKWDAVAADASGVALGRVNALTATIRSLAAGNGIAIGRTGDLITISALSTIPVGALMPWSVSRDTLPAGWLPRDGQLVSRAVWPALWALVSASAVTDAVWLAAPYANRGRYSSGDGSTTFRMPDTNGKHPDGNTIAAMVLRGDGKSSAGTPGLHQRDQVQGFTYDVYSSNTAGSGGSNNTRLMDGTNPNTNKLPDGTIKGPVTDGTNGTPRTGAETRGSNETVIMCTVAAGSAVNPGTVDVTALAAQTAGLANDVVLLQARPRPLGDGQDWVAFPTGRVVGTTYTNDSGRSIEVMISKASSNVANNLAVTVQGVQIMSVGTGSANANMHTVSFVVPAGRTYRVDVTGGASVNLWSELR